MPEPRYGDPQHDPHSTFNVLYSLRSQINVLTAERDALLARLVTAEAEADQLHRLLEQADEWIDNAVCGRCGEAVARRSEP